MCVTKFVQETKLFQSCVNRGDSSLLPTLDKFLKDNDLPFNNTIKNDNEDHLQEMHQQFSVYFPEGMLNDSQWVRNPFILDSKALLFNLLPKEQEQ